MLDTDDGRRVATPASTWTARASAEATDARPGMGAGRMAMMRWLTRRSKKHLGYQPRHRSTRRAAADADWHDTDTWDEVQATQPGRQPGRYGPASRRRSDLHDHLSSDQLRHLLEGCALDDVARIVRPLVQIIAHSSHSGTTLAIAWAEFRRSTRDAYALHVGACRWSDFFRREELGVYPAEDAVEMKLREADHAWQLLITGVP